MACRLDGKQAYDGRPLCKELTETGREEKERWVTFPGKLARILRLLSSRLESNSKHRS